jgi:chromosomal replication initiation ATPase DnaA
MSVESIVADLDRRDALHLARSIADKHWVPLEDMLGRSRKTQVARARRELWATLYEEAIPTFAALGRVFERDRTTIKDAVRKHEAQQRAAKEPT